MRKLVLAAAGIVVAGAATAALGMGPSSADPASINTLNVVGEPYAKAVAILRAQGVPATFGGSVGSDVPQAQCVVKSQKILGRKMQLMLDCTAEAQGGVPTAPTKSATSPSDTSGTAGSGTSAPPPADTGRPTAGAPGVVTVVPTRVG